MMEPTPEEYESLKRDLDQVEKRVDGSGRKRHRVQAFDETATEGHVATSVWKGRVRVDLPPDLHSLFMSPKVARRFGQRLISLARRAKRDSSL